jgi:hypothetical protein
VLVQRAQACGLDICFMKKPTAYDSKGYKICPKCHVGKPNGSIELANIGSKAELEIL